MTPATAVYLGWAGSPESERVEAAVRASFAVVCAGHFSFGESVDQGAIAPDGADFLFSFGPLIVREPLLSRIRVAAVNFHTGPPRWPGRGSVSFALLHGDSAFGVTAHLMTERVDQGPILRVLSFPIEPHDDVASLDARAKASIPILAESLISDLARGAVSPIDVSWERDAVTHAEMMRAMRIANPEDHDEVAAKVRAFAHPRKPGPYVELAGRRYWYMGGTP